MWSIILISKGKTLPSFIFCFQHINDNPGYQLLLMVYFLKKSIKQLNGDENEYAKAIKFKTSFHSSHKLWEILSCIRIIGEKKKE